MNRSLFIDTVLLFIISMLFAAGLLVSGMSRRINILQFLQIDKNWDPLLLVVLGCGVIQRSDCGLEGCGGWILFWARVGTRRTLSRTILCAF